ncbi:MAG: hypothetical protein LBJ59_09835 [Zoogloeaceae bacterium]|jgi:hypothetical protein|nr:hypothetical protein [Zoogloeaceae bacterium]
MNDEEDEALILIEDTCIPLELREHAARFKTIVRYAGFYGANIVLFAEDGEVIDICSLTN